MDELLQICPGMDYAALEEEVLQGPLADDNYLFYRSGATDSGWPEVDGEPGSMWELYCTACHQRFYEPKRKGFKVSLQIQCPECGARVEAKRWMTRRDLRTRILFFKFQRGERRRVWLRAYQVTHSFCPNPGDEGLYFYETARYLFGDGEAWKWSRTAAYFGREHKTEWRRRRGVTGYVWRVNPMCSWDHYPTHFGEIPDGFFRGSCLEYSQVGQAMEAGYSVPEYLDFYVRNPMIEYLWKFGLSNLLWEGLMQGDRAKFRKAVNLRAKKPSGLLRGMSAAEAREFAKASPCCGLATVYQRLKKEGAVWNAPECWEWAQAVYHRAAAAERARERRIGAKTLRRYIERQARRSGHGVRDTLSDYGDYLRQLDQIGGGELLPDDLGLAHERLSMRLNKVKDMTLNRKFRARRRLYGWLRWRHDGMLIRPVDSVQEITREGEQQHNCVAGYARRHADGETIICVLRLAEAPGTSWHTVELNPRTLEIVQCRGYRNQKADPKAAAFVEAWTERLKDIREGRKAA